MTKTLIVFGYGTGISDAVAKKFGEEGFQLALVARNVDKLEKACSKLRARGISATSFPGDLSDPSAGQAIVRRVAAELGPVTAIHWNAYTGVAGNVMTADASAVRAVFDVAVTTLVLAIQEAYHDLKAAKGAVLVTNGGFALFDQKIDAFVVQSNAMGVAIGNAAKHKLFGLLSERLRADEITVGEVMVMDHVKGTAWDPGNATIEPATIAEKFWEIYSESESKVVTVG